MDYILKPPTDYQNAPGYVKRVRKPITTHIERIEVKPRIKQNVEVPHTKSDIISKQQLNTNNQLDANTTANAEINIKMPDIREEIPKILEKAPESLSVHQSAGEVKVNIPHDKLNKGLNIEEGAVGGNNYKQHVINKQEMLKLLQGYIEVPKEFWIKGIEFGTHIRYQNKTGDYKRGGFLKFASNKVLVLESWKGGKKGQLYGKGKKHRYYQWTIKLDNISKIWKKIDTSNKVETHLTNQSITNMQLILKRHQEMIQALGDKISAQNDLIDQYYS